MQQQERGRVGVRERPCAGRAAVTSVGDDVSLSLWLGPPSVCLSLTERTVDLREWPLGGASVCTWGM